MNRKHVSIQTQTPPEDELLSSSDLGCSFVIKYDTDANTHLSSDDSAFVLTHYTSQQDDKSIQAQFLKETLVDSQNSAYDCFEDAFDEGLDHTSLEYVHKVNGIANGDINMDPKGILIVPSQDDLENASIAMGHSDILLDLHKICCCLSKIDIPLEKFSSSDLEQAQFVDNNGKECCIQNYIESTAEFTVNYDGLIRNVALESLVAMITVQEESDILKKPSSLVPVPKTEKMEVVGKKIHESMIETAIPSALTPIVMDNMSKSTRPNYTCDFCGSRPSCKWTAHCNMIWLEVDIMRSISDVPLTDEDCRLEFYRRMREGGVEINTCVVHYARRKFPRPPSFTVCFADFQEDEKYAPFLEFVRERKKVHQMRVLSANVISFCVGAMVGKWW